MDVLFNAEVATKYDVDVAIFLHFMAIHTEDGLIRKQNIHDGYCWVTTNLDALFHFLPFWSRQELLKVLNKCIKNDLLIVGNYNEHYSGDKHWYAFTPTAYLIYSGLAKPKYIERLCLSLPEDKRDEWAKRFNVKTVHEGNAEIPQPPSAPR